MTREELRDEFLKEYREKWNMKSSPENIKSNFLSSLTNRTLKEIEYYVNFLEEKLNDCDYYDGEITIRNPK
jgi:hypothetical protein